MGNALDSHDCLVSHIADSLCFLPPLREIGWLSKLNCYWFFCRYFVFALVTVVALLASPIILWLDPWEWTFPTIYFLVSANVAVVVYLYFTLFSYIFLLFSVVSGHGRLQLDFHATATVGVHNIGVMPC